MAARTSGILTPLIVCMILSRLKILTLTEIDQVQSETPDGRNLAGDEASTFDLFVQKWGKELALAQLVVNPWETPPPRNHRRYNANFQRRQYQTWRHEADTAKLFRTLLLLGGDISTNPGPVRFPCVECKRPVARNQRGIECDSCELWTHAKCIEMSISEHESLTEDETWLCSKCQNQVKIGKLTELKEINVLTYDDVQLGLIFNQNSQMLGCQVQPSGKRLSRI